MQLSLTHASIFVPSLICLLALAKCILVKKENKLLSEQLTKTTIILETNKKKLRDLENRHNDIKEFQKSIEHAELTTKLQTPRLQVAHGTSTTQPVSNAPEKYSYVRSLSEKGMTPEEIGTVLSISPHEASQLVALTMITTAS